MFTSSNIKRTGTVWEVFSNQPYFRLLGILSVIALIKIVIFTQFDLDSEEAQYWLWSKHPQLSYYSKPPLIAHLNWFSTSIFGDTVFGIRINAVIIGFLISIVSYLLAFELFKNYRTALLAAIITNTFPFLLHSSIVFTTDTLLILFWLCALLFFWKAAETRKRVWWVLLGVSIGLGALSKYAIFFIYIPLVLFSWKYHRDIFKTRGFYLSILITLLIFSPVIYWNINQQGVGFLHLISLSGVYDHSHSAKKSISNLLEFGIGQIIILLPFYQYGKIIRGFRQKTITRQEEYLILPAICTLIFFLIISIMRRSGAYVNWAMYAYAGMPLLFSHFAVSGNRVKLNRRISILLAVILLLFVGLTSPANRIVPIGKANPANKLIGWSQLGAIIDSVKNTLPPESCFVFSTNYHITSKLNFYMKGQPATYFLNVNSRMTQFDLWKGTEQFMNTDKTGILVDRSRISPEIRQVFNTILKEDSCAIYSQNSQIKTYYIYLVQGMKSIPKKSSSY